MILWLWQLVSNNQLQSSLSNSLSFVGCYGNGSANLCDGKNSNKNRVRPGIGRTLPSQFTIWFVDNNRELHIANTLLRIALLEKLAIKSAYDSDMYNRAFPVGNALFFFAGGVMSLFCLP